MGIDNVLFLLHSVPSMEAGMAIFPPIEALKELLTYSAETGDFTWRKNLKGPVKTGMIAGSKHSRGYTTIRIDGSDFLAHRLAFYMSGREIDDSLQIDHINGNKADNRLCNLRIATFAENNQNITKKKNNRSGYKGICFDAKRNLYRARIRANNKVHWIGYFKNPEDAHAAYCKTAEKLHGHFYRP
jgi:hypothetical protein